MLSRYSDDRRRLQYHAPSEAFFVSAQGAHLNHNNALAVVRTAHEEAWDVAEFRTGVRAGALADTVGLTSGMCVRKRAIGI
jgi:hypothetical protein